jgi:hypothetical protein
MGLSPAVDYLVDAAFTTHLAEAWSPRSTR